ncbi:SWIRM domain-containing protein [Rutstroemia sp. NJR-2017a WRK4]|nr:SWIRM domain-containing protein [Rutstroemia sp. NJR-2017a WRK4]
MDDKTFTSILQPSISFDRRQSPIATKPFANSSTHTPTPSTSSINSILSTPNRFTIMDRKNHFSITNSLMSPPEALPLDNLQRTSSGLAIESKMRKMQSMVSATFPISPPVSPETKLGSPEEPTISQITDPILYPSDSQSTSATQPSLFDNDDSLVTQRVVDGHVAARKASMFREFSPPRQDEYELALEFKSQVAKTFNKNPRLWFRREMAYLMEDRELQSGGRRYTNIAPATTGPRVVRPIGQNSGRVTKTTQRPPRQSAPSRPPRVAGTPGPDVKRVAREDKDFESLPDYCPPITSLPNKPNSLKVDWKGAPIDLRQDPHVNLLHPDEVSLAANLRLDCATYLTSKRRIFIKRIETLRIGKEFRKTDAQQACKIDVNKASKLWQAFDKVGWLNATWVKKYA